MEDEASSCCSLSASSSSSHPPPPLTGRFRDIPEPAKSLMIEASVQALRQHLQHTSNGVHLIKAEERPERIQALELAVRAAEVVGLSDDDGVVVECKEAVKYLKEMEFLDAKMNEYRREQEQRGPKRRRIWPEEAEEYSEHASFVPLVWCSLEVLQPAQGGAFSR